MDKKERTITRRIVKAALAKGYTVSVYDGEEFALRRSSSERAIMKAIYSTDEDTLVMHGGERRIGQIYLVWGNGEDVVTDYTDCPEIEALVD
jgi:hypothetical protein